MGRDGRGIKERRPLARCAGPTRQRGPGVHAPSVCRSGWQPAFTSPRRVGHNSLMDVHQILAPDGLIARRLPGFESRPQQLDMAAAVADAITRKKKLLVEAGTGVGKSFAYLVPA